MSVCDELCKARNVGVPLVAINTQEPTWLCSAIGERMVGEQGSPPVVTWDCLRGLQGVGRGSMLWGLDAGVLQDEGRSEERFVGDSATDRLFSEIGQWPGEPIVILLNAQRYVGMYAVMQGICNLRDVLKRKGGMLVLVGPLITLPVELQQDVLMLTEPRPTRQELAKLATRVAIDARASGLSNFKWSEDEATQCADSMIGMGAFSAEQTLALCASESGIDHAKLQQEARKAIEQTRGISFMNGAGFDGIVGLEAAKGFYSRLMRGPDKPLAVVYIDEIDDAMTGASGGDLSGVSSDMLGYLSSWMEEYQVVGTLCTGVPGTGKSTIAAALGTEFSVPVMKLDLGGVRAGTGEGLVGQAEMFLRLAIQSIEAVSEPRRLLMIATCNKLRSLPAKLKARLALGSFFFDYPTPGAQEAAFALWLGKYGLPQQELPPHQQWVPRDIKQCCELAFRLQCSLVEAARYVVPAAQRDTREIETLRQEASGRFICADKGGLFVVSSDAAEPANAVTEELAGRKFRFYPQPEQPMVEKKMGFDLGGDK